MSGGGPAADDALLADYEALRLGVGAYQTSRDAVVVSGPEALEYLQGQLSQDVGSLEVGGSAPALLLEPDGKLCALVRATRVGEERFVVDTDAGFGEEVAARLRRFKLRTKAEIVTAVLPSVALRGRQVATTEIVVATAAASPAPDAPPAAVGGPWAVPVDWNGTVGVDVLGVGGERTAPENARWCGRPAWEALRIEAGIPAMGTELDERTIAAEAGLVERTVSFTKGCYTGQELVARLDARGSRVARRLCGVVFDAGAVGERPSPDPASHGGAVLWAPGADKPAGRITSVAWCPGVGGLAGLAYVHRSVEVPSPVEWSVTGAEEQRRPARAVSLPLVGG